MQERAWTRFRLRNERVAFVSFSGSSEQYVVDDLGYGGLGIKIQESQPPVRFRRDEVLSIELHVLDSRLRCNVQCTYSSDEGAGFCILHDQSYDIFFLKSFVPYLEMGFDGADQHSEPTTEIPHFEPARGQGGTAFKLTYRDGKALYRLEVQDGVLRTFHSVGPGTFLTELRQTGKVDKLIMKKSILILHGLANESTHSDAAKARDVVLNLYQRGNRSLRVDAA